MPLTTFLYERPAVRQRGLMLTALNDVAVIQSRTSTSDIGGDAGVAWNAKGTAVCRVYPVTMRGKGGLIGERLNERSTHFLALPLGTDITPSDRVVIAGRGTFEVTLALDTTSPFTTRVEVIQV